MSYYIENSEGKWLKDPDNPMGESCWTRDPDKAWAFNEEDSPKWSGNIRDDCPYTCHILRWFLADETKHGLIYHIKEYDFKVYTNQEDIINGLRAPDLYIDMITRIVYSPLQR
jgi:hypothetical protein